MYAAVEAEGKRLRNPFDTITEGVGLNRLTANFDQAAIDGAFKCEAGGSCVQGTLARRVGAVGQMASA